MPEELVKRAGSPAKTVRPDTNEEVITVGGPDATTEAMVAAAEAEIKSRILLARKFPRDEDQFREDILKACRRPLFAEAALFHKPAGFKQNDKGKWEQVVIVDLSIRFVEAALQYFGNAFIASRIIGENQDYVKLNVSVVDVQRNFGYSQDSLIEKVVERREVKKGRKLVGHRENTSGDLVYLVTATRDELRNLIGAERSKLIRDNGKRMLPRDVLDEARALIDQTLLRADTEEPDAAKKKILDTFSALGISALMLKEYLGQPVEALGPKDVASLRLIYNALKEGDTTWPELLRARDEEAESEPGEAPKPGGLKDRVKAQASALPEESAEPAKK